MEPRYENKININEKQQNSHLKDVVDAFTIHNDLKVSPKFFQLKAHLALRNVGIISKRKST